MDRKQGLHLVIWEAVRELLEQQPDKKVTWSERSTSQPSDESKSEFPKWLGISLQLRCRGGDSNPYFLAESRF